MVKSLKDSLPFWYLQTFVPCITCPSLIYTFSLPFWYFSNFWPLYVIRRCKSERDRWYKGQKFEDTKRVMRRCKSERNREYKGQKFERYLLITLLVSFKLLSLVSPVPLWFTPSHYPFGIFKLLALVSPVPLWFTPSDYPFGIFKPLSLEPSIREGQVIQGTKVWKIPKG
jgi:hypothetical protein